MIQVLVHRSVDDTGWIVIDDPSRAFITFKKDGILLRDVTFVIDEALRLDALHSTEPILHAWIRGNWIVDDANDWTRAQHVTYSPQHGFLCDNQPITSCDFIYFGLLRTILAFGASPRPILRNKPT